MKTEPKKDGRRPRDDAKSSGFNKESPGAAKKFRERTKRELAVIAYHEAGHAVALWKFGYRIDSATIVPDPAKGLRGCVNSKEWTKTCRRFLDAKFPSKKLITFARNSILMLRGGRCAALRFDPACHAENEFDEDIFRPLEHGGAENGWRRTVRDPVSA